MNYKKLKILRTDDVSEDRPTYEISAVVNRAGLLWEREVEQVLLDGSEIHLTREARLTLKGDSFDRLRFTKARTGPDGHRAMTLSIKTKDRQPAIPVEKI